MRNEDVVEANGRKKSRWSAVFECALEMVQEQRNVMISLITFDKKVKQSYTKLRSSEAIVALRSLRGERPKGPTNFSRPFHEVKRIVDNVVRGSDKVMVVFLSDGKPGDLRQHPPHAGEDFQSHYN